MIGRVALVALIVLGILLAGLGYVYAASWEIWAKRSGANLREDQQNIMRIRQNGEEPFASREEAQSAAEKVKAAGHKATVVGG